MVKVVLVTDEIDGKRYYKQYKFESPPNCWMYIWDVDLKCELRINRVTYIAKSKVYAVHVYATGQAMWELTSRMLKSGWKNKCAQVPQELLEE